MPEKRAGLDTDVLLVIQAAEPAHVEVHRRLSAVGFVFIATPSVVKELDEAAQRTDAEYTRALALNILSYPTGLGLILRSALDFTDTQGEVTDIHVNRVINRGVVGEASRAALTALIEAAYFDCMLFVTSCAELVTKRHAIEAALVQDCGMGSIYIFSPSEILEFFPVRS